MNINFGLFFMFSLLNTILFRLQIHSVFLATFRYRCHPSDTAHTATVPYSSMHFAFSMQLVISAIWLYHDFCSMSIEQLKISWERKCVWMIFYLEIIVFNRKVWFVKVKAVKELQIRMTIHACPNHSKTRKTGKIICYDTSSNPYIW